MPDAGGLGALAPELSELLLVGGHDPRVVERHEVLVVDELGGVVPVEGARQDATSVDHAELVVHDRVGVARVREALDREALALELIVEGVVGLGRVLGVDHDSDPDAAGLELAERGQEGLAANVVLSDVHLLLGRAEGGQRDSLGALVGGEGRARPSQGEARARPKEDPTQEQRSSQPLRTETSHVLSFCNCRAASRRA